MPHLFHDLVVRTIRRTINPLDLLSQRSGADCDPTDEQEGPRVRQAGTNLPKVGRYNQAVVLDQIQLADGISRVEIAERTGLTPQTVSGIVRRLIDEGMVREDGA